MTETVKSPLEMFYHWEQNAADDVYLRQPKSLEWTEYTWREVGDQIRRIASYINSKNYPAGSRIAIWSSNSKDWPIVDLAIQLSGHISVPIYPGQDTESAHYIFNHSECRMLFAGSFDQAENVQNALTDDMVVVGMLGCTIDCETTTDEIIQQYPRYEESPIPDPDDVFTIVYTSGTTGNPKGVMHMHKTPGLTVPGLVESFIPPDSERRMFSFLPMSHAAERIAVEMMSLYSNSCVSFSEGLVTFADEIRSVQPTFFFAVPRLWVKFKEGIDAKVPPAAQEHLTDEQKKAIAYQLGLGEASFILTGSAPCPRDVQDWFLKMGIALRDGYGMTENFIHGCAWVKDDQPISGCVGQPMDDTVGVRVSDEGEIQFKSAGLMKGYYKNPEKTAEVFTEDGWYKSGDSGTFDEEGNLWVTGRISEVFKTSKGKFIVPTKLEQFFGRSAHLAQVLVMGHAMDQPVLMATPSEIGKSLSKKELKKHLHELLDEINDHLPSHEKIAQIFLSPEWTIENRLLTPTMKLKRKHIEEKFKHQILKKLGKKKVSMVKHKEPETT